MTNLFDNPAAFAPAPVPKTIEWEQNGQSHKADIHIRPLSWQAMLETTNEDGMPQGEVLAKRIADSLCDESGQALYSAAQIAGKDGKALSPAVVLAVLTAINEVNTAGKP